MLELSDRHMGMLELSLSQLQEANLSTWVRLPPSRQRVLSMRLDSLCEEHNSWVVGWHRSAPSQSLDQRQSEHNAEIAINAIRCIHWGK